MEWLQASLAFVLGGLFTAAVTEWRAQAAEGRAKQQRADEWDRQREAAKRERLRNAILRDLQETRSYFLAQEAFLLARAEGRVVPFPGQEYPNQDLLLLGDPALQVEQVEVSIEMLKLPPGGGLPMPLLHRNGALHARAMRALKDQEARALTDEPLREVTEEEATRYFTAELQAQRVERLVGREVVKPSKG